MKNAHFISSGGRSRGDRSKTIYVTLLRLFVAPTGSRVVVIFFVIRTLVGIWIRNAARRMIAITSYGQPLVGCVGAPVHYSFRLKIKVVPSCTSNCTTRTAIILLRNDMVAPRLMDAAPTFHQIPQHKGHHMYRRQENQNQSMHGQLATGTEVSSRDTTATTLPQV